MKYAEVDSPVGTIDIHRGPSGYPRVEGLARTSENWSLRLGDRELLAVQGLAAPGYPARATAKTGLDAVLCGQPGRLIAQRSLRNSERFVRFSSPEFSIGAVKQSGRCVVLDSRDTQCASLRHRREWSVSVETDEVCAFVALLMAAGLEEVLASPLLDLLP
ncbi:hypothetical protein [Kitasatospora sp. NPDC093558]|uniref:hypothetical protein n=1 Tax=Kitasatospora sp. NPDC093558 TaxID=3155201 RepID=UPI003440AF82